MFRQFVFWREPLGPVENILKSLALLNHLIDLLRAFNFLEEADLDWPKLTGFRLSRLRRG